MSLLLEKLRSISFRVPNFAVPPDEIFSRDFSAALDKPAVVLPVSLQEKIAEEKQLEQAKRNRPRGSASLTPEQLKTQQQG